MAYIYHLLVARLDSIDVSYRRERELIEYQD